VTRRRAAAEWLDVDDLRPWDRNPRVSESQPVAEVAASIEHLGFGAPIVARRSGRTVIAGHTRLRAVQQLLAECPTWPTDRRQAFAVRLGVAEADLESTLRRVPVRLVDLDEHEAVALALADNRLGELAGWDSDLLREALDGLAEVEIPSELLGWTDRDLAELFPFEADGTTGEDIDGPTRQVHEGPALSERGRVYRLGPHVLVCGDCRTPDPWVLLDGERGERGYDVVWTDPPYGVAYEAMADRPKPKQRAKQHKQIENDGVDLGDLESFLRDVFGFAYERTAPGGSWYVAAPDQPARHPFGTVLLELPTLWRHSIVWVKDLFVLGRSDRHYKHETLFYGWRDGGPHVWTGGRQRTSVIECPRPRASGDHPTEKPVDLVSECLVCHRVSGAELVLDPFGGSGTTLVAAQQLGMRAHLIEIEPHYCDVIRRRWGNLARSAGIEPGQDAL
jgi:DNA modification methylase